MKISILCVFIVICSMGFSQSNIFSISYSNQIGVNQFNSIQNDYHNNDKIKSGFSYKNIGFSFARKISDKRNLWLNFSISIWDEEFGFDHQSLFSKPEHDPFNQLTEEDFQNPSPQQRSTSYLQMVDMQLSLKRTCNVSFWGLEFQPEIGLFTKSDFGLHTGFQYGNSLYKEPYYYNTITRYRTNIPTNNNDVFVFGSMNINKTFFDKLQLGLDVSYFPRIKFDYEVSTVVNITGFDSNGEQQVYYFNEVNDYTKAQLVYDLFRFGFNIGYKF